MHVGACVQAGVKQFEVRAVGSVLRVKDGFRPCKHCELVFFCGAHMYLRCRLTAAVYFSAQEGLPALQAFMTAHNWRLFVPWAHTLEAALSVYAALDTHTGSWSGAYVNRM